MFTSLLRAATAAIIAVTPLAAQQAVAPLAPARSAAETYSTLESRYSWLNAETAPWSIADESAARQQSPAIDPSKSNLLFKLGPGDSVGYTYYDLQTNASMQDRIINWPDAAKPLGAVGSSLVWMASTDTPPATGDYTATTRGTYGAQFDGTSWAPFGGSWTRIEGTLRTGFPEVGKLSDGRIIVANHSSTKVHVWVQVDAGGSDFVQIDIPGSEGGLWPSLSVSNNNDVHVIWTTQPAQGSGVRPEVFYSVSTNGGESFSDAVALSGAASVVTDIPNGLVSGFGANSYVVSARDEKVVVWYLSSSLNLIQLSSFDRGATWAGADALGLFGPRYSRVYTQHDDADSVFWNDPEFGADTIGFRSDTVATPGSSMDMLLDANGDPHGVITIYPTYLRRYYLTGEDTTAATFRSGIIYQARFNYTDVGMLYIKVAGNQLTRRPIAQPGGLASGADPATPNYFIRRAYHGGWSLYPQIGFDANTNVYLTFASGIDGDVQAQKRGVDSATKNWYFHHTFVTWMRSTDPDGNWLPAINLTPNGVDAKYGSLADLVDEQLQIAYQVDPIVGEMITDPAAPLPRQKNNVEVLFLPQSSLPDPSGIRDEAAPGSSLSIGAWPVPSTGEVSVKFTTSSTSLTSLCLVDALGRTVATLASDVLPAATYTRTVDGSQLPTGTYWLVLKNGGAVSTTRVEIAR